MTSNMVSRHLIAAETARRAVWHPWVLVSSLLAKSKPSCYTASTRACMHSWLHISCSTVQKLFERGCVWKQYRKVWYWLESFPCVYSDMQQCGEILESTAQDLHIQLCSKVSYEITNRWCVLMYLCPYFYVLWNLMMYSILWAYLWVSSSGKTEGGDKEAYWYHIYWLLFISYVA